MTHPKSSQLVCGLFSAFFLAASAQADSLQSAQSGLNQAYQNFYQSYKSSPNHTNAEASKLSSQILTPAETSVQQALHQETLQTFQKNGITLQGTGGKSGNNERIPATEVSTSASAKKTTFEAEPVPEEPLDSSEFAPELEFPGTPQKKP